MYASLKTNIKDRITNHSMCTNPVNKQHGGCILDQPLEYISVAPHVGFNRMIIHQDSLRWEHYRFQLNYLHVQHWNSEMQSFPLTTEDLLIDIYYVERTSYTCMQV
jgi:hypothetical protein